MPSYSQYPSGPACRAFGPAIPSLFTHGLCDVGFSFFDAPDASAEPVALRRLPFAFAKRRGVLLHLGADGARMVYRPGASLPAVGEALRFAGLPLDVAEVDIATFDQALSEAYQQDSSAAMQMVEGLGDDMDLASLAERLPETEDLMEQEDDAPIIRLINAILSEAVKENASDIHVETFEKRLVVRFRIDGILREMVQPRRELAGLLVSWIKVVAKQRICREALSVCRYSYVAGVVGGIRKRELFQISSEE